MDKQQLLTDINDALRQDWTRGELVSGKRVSIPWEARPLLRDAIRAYTGKGWRIVTRVTITGAQRGIELEFSNPRWNLDSLGIA
jgi:hypothetical protein